MKKTRAEKGYAYGMLWSFKMSVTCKFFLTSRRTTVPVVKELLSDITQTFTGHCAMSGAYIHAWRRSA